MDEESSNNKKLISAEIQKLSTVVEGLAVTSLEAKRCTEDLKTIEIRLRSREYEQSCFKPRGTLSIPDRTQELLSDLSFFWSVGAVWQNLFDRIELKPSASVLDIGCGYFPKVELGLYYHGFEGTVTLCDPHREALEQASQFLKFFRVPFEAQTHASTVWDIGEKRFDAVVANHVLDDLILASYAKEHSLDIGALYSDEDNYMAVWTAISKTTMPAGLLQQLVHTLITLLAPCGVILFLDYPSFSHRALGMRHLQRVVGDFRAQLVRALRDAGLRELSLLGENTIRRDRLVIKDSYVMAFKKDYQGDRL
jgi:hypothetical protein